MMDEENDFVKKLKEEFNEREESQTKVLPKKQQLFFCDKGGTMGILAKTQRMKNLLEQFFEEDELPQPKIDYTKKPKGNNNAFFKIESLAFIAQLLSLSDSKKTLVSLAENAPIRFETEDFTVFLAPRQEPKTNIDWEDVS